jgi:diketogulonate reductase-like aldo/keto reductase
LIEDPKIFYRALKNGYRHFDIAKFYDNEEKLGEGL